MKNLLYFEFGNFCRKTEYKIEVLIPPNISDPLNLNAGGNDKDFAAKLISPLSKKKKVKIDNKNDDFKI